MVDAWVRYGLLRLRLRRRLLIVPSMFVRGLLFRRGMEGLAPGVEREIGFVVKCSGCVEKSFDSFVVE